MFYRRPDLSLLLLILSAAFLQLSCSTHDNEKTPDIISLEGIPDTVEIISYVPDKAAAGLVNSWYRPEQFPQDKSVEAYIADDLPYYWFSFRMHLLPDSATLGIMPVDQVSGDLKIWLNGQLLQTAVTGDIWKANFPTDIDSSDIIIIRQSNRGNTHPGIKLFLISGKVLTPEKENQEEKVQRYEYFPAAQKFPQRIYKVFLRNFTRNGTFNGLENRLDYVRSLHADAVLLMPIHPAEDDDDSLRVPSPYSVSRYFSTDPDKGSRDQFRKMCRAADSLGLDFLIEAVLDRSSSKHYYIFKRPGLYIRDEQGNTISPLVNGRMIRSQSAVNTGSDEFFNLLDDYSAFWSEELFADGFYYLNSEMIFYDQRARKTISEKYLDLIRITDYPLNTADKMFFPGAMNISNAFFHALVYTASGASADTLFSVLQAEAAKISPAVHYIENTGTEKAHQTFGEALYAASFLNFILPGIPMIYSGQELINAPYLNLRKKTDLNWYNTDSEFNRISDMTADLRTTMYSDSVIWLEKYEIPGEGFALKVINDDVIFLAAASFDSADMHIEQEGYELLFTDSGSRIAENEFLLSPYGYFVAKKSR